MTKHDDFWYFILPTTTVPKPTWFNIVQENNINTVKYSNDGTKYILKAKKEYISPQIVQTLGASTYTQVIHFINNFEPENWEVNEENERNQR
tara:strand:+ start:340 stop:615 length:276 start_codon:yes stop_codon:yes gene_type:complete